MQIVEFQNCWRNHDVILLPHSNLVCFKSRYCAGTCTRNDNGWPLSLFADFLDFALTVHITANNTGNSRTVDSELLL